MMIESGLFFSFDATPVYLVTTDADKHYIHTDDLFYQLLDADAREAARQIFMEMMTELEPSAMLVW